MGKKTQHIAANRRVMAYWTTGIALAGGIFLSREITWTGSAELHTVMETLATFLAAFVGMMALVRFYSRKDYLFLYIGVGFLGTGFLDGYHAIVTSFYFKPMMPSDLPHLIPWSWVASRQFLSVMMCLGWLGWWREQRDVKDGRIEEITIYLSALIFTLASFLFFAFAPLPRAYYPEFVFHRPEEFAPALFFLLALVGFLQKGRWRDDAFEHWLVLSLIVGLVGQAAFMSFSGKLFDYEFDIAHMLKKVSYVCVLTGLAINMFHSFSALHKNESRINAIIDTAIDGFITIGESGRITSADKTAETIFGYSAGGLIDRNVEILMPSPDREEHEDNLEPYRWTGVVRPLNNNREIIGERKDGSQFPMETRIAELPAIDGKHEYVITVRDISERKSQERALYDSELRFKDFAGAASDWFWEMDTELRLSYLSGSFEQISEGARRDKFLGMTLQELCWVDTDHNKWQDHDADLSAHKPIKDFQFVFMTPRENEQYWSISGRPVFDVDGEFLGYRGVGQDITEKTKAQEELEAYGDHLEVLVDERTEELARQAEQLEVALVQEQKHNTLQREFVAMVSHEFRTPLAIIDGAAQRVERRKDKVTPAELSRRVVKIRNAVTRMADLIESVLSFARLDAGKMEKKGQEVDLARLVTEICQRQQEISTEHAISVDIAESGLSVWGDPKLLDQVFTNLVSNAVKYSPSDPRIEVRGWMKDDYAVVTVRDYGLVLVPTVNLPFVPTQNCSLFGLSMTAHRVAMLALPTERERCADVRMGDQDVVEALLGAGRLEGGAVAAVRGEPSNDPLLDRDGPTGPGSVGRCERVCAASASGAQAGPLQGDHRRAP